MSLRSLAVVLFGCTMFASAASAADRVYYEPKTAEIKGKLLRRAYYWGPKHHQVLRSNANELNWILKLDAPVDVVGDKQSFANQYEANVREVQLVVEETGRRKYWQELMDKHADVVASGYLFHKQKGDNYTTVYMKVNDLHEAH